MGLALVLEAQVQALPKGLKAQVQAHVLYKKKCLKHNFKHLQRA